MSSLFDRIRNQGSERDAQRRPGRYRHLDWTAEFDHPASPGCWTVQPNVDPWRIVDGRGVVRLLCDTHATVCTINGDRLLAQGPDIAGTMLPRSAGGIAEAFIQVALGAVLTDPRTGEPTGGPGPSSRLIREPAGLVIARVTDGNEGIRFELLPDGPLNNKIIARRLPSQLATRIRALGPPSYAIIDGGPPAGVGQLRGPAGQLIATDRFAYLPPMRRSDTLHRTLETWTVHVDNNPFPAPWLFALLRATKTVT